VSLWAPAGSSPLPASSLPTPERAADAEGHRAVGTWIAEAADRHLDAVSRAGKPLPLAWRKGRFSVRLSDGTEAEINPLN
jgi:hypothetical protein